MSFLSTFSKAAAGLVLAAGMTATAVPATFAADYSKDNPLKVVLVLHGNLGDKSFFDSAAAGLKQAEADLPVTVKIIEAGYDKSKWQPALADATDGDYDVVIAGTFDMTPYVSDLAPQYPDKKFIIFDDAPDYSKCDCGNVLGINYQTSSAGYLAGYAAAKISKSGVIGETVGMDFPTVTDFKVGFDQGAKAANPDIKILSEVAGTFSDPAKGKEIALAQIGQGADIIFPDRRRHRHRGPAGGPRRGRRQAGSRRRLRPVRDLPGDRSGAGLGDLHLGGKEGRPVALPRPQGDDRRHPGIRQG